LCGHEALTLGCLLGNYPGPVDLRELGEVGHGMQGAEPSPLGMLHQSGTISTKPLCFGAVTGILVKEKEIILDYICKASSGKLLKSFWVQKGILALVWQCVISRGSSLINTCPPCPLLLFSTILHCSHLLLKDWKLPLPSTASKKFLQQQKIL